MKNLLSIWFSLLLLCFCLGVGAQSTYKIVRKIHLEGDGGWDYLIADNATGRLYVSHATMAQVVDLKTGKLAGTVPDTKGIHGIAIAEKFNKGFTSNGRDSSVSVFDLKTLEITGRIKINGRNPDAILFDPFSNKVFTFNGGSSNATVIDAATNTIVATIPLEGKPEFSVTDGKGKIYVNIEDKSLISLINTSSLKVEKSWSIAPGEDPSGLALDNETNRLFSVCGNKLMVISDAIGGKVLTSLPIGDRCDGVAFDPALRRAYSSNGEGTITVVQEESKDSFKVIETITTQRGARTITVDKSTHHLYLSTADYEATPSGDSRRPAIKPNSFVILDVAPAK